MKNIIYRNLFLFAAIALSLFTSLSGCGEGTIDLNEAKYQPKIVMEAYIYPNHKVEKILITRNVPFDKPIDFNSVILKDAKVLLTDLNENKSYELKYNSGNFSYEDFNNIIQVNYEKSFKLEVWAKVDGKDLYTSSTTVVPMKGLQFEENSITSIQYREKDELGNLKKYHIRLKPSPGASIHAVSIIAEEPGLENFIYENPYFKPDTSDIKKDIDEYSHSYYWLQNYKPGANQLDFEIEWMSVWFYTRYRVIIYAGDKNFKDFFLTQKNVQEMDGNFHEPILHIEGDGIGVFASAVVDTTYFQVIK